MSRFLSLLLGSLFMLTLTAQAEPTRVLVHVKSKDAKFVGTSMGGVQIVIRDAATGELLAKGLTAGATGDTERLMRQPHVRHQPLSTAEAASYLAELDLTEPTKVTIAATGPLAQRQSAVTVSQEQWLFPGQHIDQGDGIVLILPGFVVDVLSPPAHLKLKEAREVEIRANITMVCGCPVEPDGLWDAHRFQLWGRVLRNGQKVDSIELSYAGTPSQFAGSYTPPQSGAYEIQILALDPANGNTGLDSTTFIVP